MGGGYTHQTKGTPGALAAEVNKMKVEIDALRRAIANLGIQIDPVGGRLVIAAGRSLEVDGSETVGGSLTVSGSETISGSLDVTGPATFGGNLDVAGTLSLPNGIINNDALANPIASGIADGDQSGYTFTASNTAFSQSLAVPSGFSTALVLAIATTGMSSTQNSVFSARATIAGATGPTINAECAANSAMSVTAAYGTIVTGLNGGSIQVTANGSTTGICSAGSGNLHITATAIFLR